MGIVAESFDDLPPAADLPGADWGVDGWNELIVRYEAARRTLLAFDSEPADEIPHELVQRARELKSAIADALRDYIEQANQRPVVSQESTFSALQRGIVNVLEQVLASLRPMLRVDAAELSAAARALRDASDRVAESEARVEDLESRAKVIIERVGVGRLAKHYEEEAAHQANAARRWLVGVGITTVLLAGVVLWLILEDRSMRGDVEWEALGSMLATKALALGVLSYVVSFCAKNYRSHRHLHATYRQRMSALDTYSLMALSLRDDPEDRRLVLQELAKAVFAPSDTGLTGGAQTEKTVIENMPVFPAMRGGG